MSPIALIPIPLSFVRQFPPLRKVVPFVHVEPLHVLETQVQHCPTAVAFPHVSRLGSGLLVHYFP